MAGTYTPWDGGDAALKFILLCLAFGVLGTGVVLGDTNVVEQVPAVAADNLEVDKAWLRETVRPLLAALAIFLMLVLGSRLVQATAGKREERILCSGTGIGARLWHITRNLGSDFWAVAAIVLVMALLGLYTLFFLCLLGLYAGVRIGYVLLRERTLVSYLAQEQALRADADEAQTSEINDFFSNLGKSRKPKPQRQVPAAGPIRVEVRPKQAQRSIDSERFLTSRINENCYFSSLPAARRAPLAAELIRKLHLRWKEFEVRTDSLYLNRQDPTGGADQVCVLALSNTQDRANGLLINAGFLQWALGSMVGKNDLVYETEDGYHAPDETERAQIALLPENRRPHLIPVKDIVNPWHAMIGRR